MFHFKLNQDGNYWGVIHALGLFPGVRKLPNSGCDMWAIPGLSEVPLTETVMEAIRFLKKNGALDYVRE